MQLDINKPARLYGTAKTHKYETLEDITVANLKFRPIIDQTGTLMYNAAKVISDYLRPSQRTQTSLRRLQDVLKRSRRLTTKQDVVPTSRKRRLIDDVLETSDLRRLEDVELATS